MRRGTVSLVGRVLVMALAALLAPSVPAQELQNPDRLLEEAERLAWLKAWARAEPLYAEAARLYAARGDRRNEVFAEINRLRGELPRLPVPVVSQRLAEFLDDPIVQADDRVRLRCLVIKGETDEDLDPTLAEESWREALEIAQRIGEPRWANRARGELGFVAFMMGDLTSGIISVSQAIAEAQKNGDTPSLVRWLTLFGVGYLELGRPQQAIDFFDRALKVAESIPELRSPVMTYVAKGDALVKLGRDQDAEVLIDETFEVASQVGALGYQAQLTMKRAEIAARRGQTGEAMRLLDEAAAFANQAGGDRLFAEVTLAVSGLNLALKRPDAADAALADGITAARKVGGHLLLARLLAARADVLSGWNRHAEAGELLEEASDLLEGVLTKTSSPWVRSRVIGSMDELFLARLRLEASAGQDAGRAFAIVEQARGRTLVDLMLSTPIADFARSPELRQREREIAALQVKLLTATGRAERQRLLDQIFIAEGQLAPVTTELFRLTQTAPRRPLTLKDVQQALRPDEVLLEFTLTEPDSYCIVVTRSSARLQRLPGKSAIEGQVTSLLTAVREGKNPEAEARTVSATLLTRIPELARHRRVIVSPDGELHQLPFELLPASSGQALLHSHVVSYTPSGSVLAILRNRAAQPTVTRVALAVSASPDATGPDGTATASTASVLRDVPRGVYDLDVARLPSLPSANAEARSVGTTLGADVSTVLIGEASTELALKRQPLQDYRVLHFAVHGILSTKSPTRSALLLRPAAAEDGLLQAWEVLSFRLRAELVTLSACDTGTGVTHGQEGVSSLVRPFLAAGARTVVANLWAADDRFSLTLMREFYRRLATGADVAEALRAAKLRMLELFGPQAVPRLWSGLLVYGDGANTVTTGGPAGQPGAR
jgi:CHAT domain-containing protein